MSVGWELGAAMAAVPGSAEVIRADARRLPLADESVDLIVTSPPYFALRSYQDGGEHYEGQIGSEPTPAEFIDALIEVTRECIRVLKPSGSLWVNLGDKYSANWNSSRAAGGAGIREQGRSREARTLRPDGFPYRPKTLLGLPWRYAIRCIDELDLILRAEVIWDKPNGLPESVTDRVRRSHEQWFHFVLQPRYFSAVDEIREPHAAATVKRAQPHRAPAGRRGAEIYQQEESGQTLDRDQMMHPLGRLPGSVWEIPSEPLKVPEGMPQHFAAFPTEWPRRIIAGWSPAGICVACGQGRRPITQTEQLPGRVNATTDRPRRQDTTGHPGTGFNVAGYPKTTSATRIAGYACECSEPIGSPLGRAGEADPSRETGRGGFNRPRAAGEGVRWITRWEQRHEALQLRNSPHRAVMAEEAGSAFAHYVRTDVAGARPIPEDLRRSWQERGWLLEAPQFHPPPTRPAVVIDPFGGTGTVAMVAAALGRRGISFDLSGDYCRLAQWRCHDRDQLAKVLGIGKVEKPHAEEQSLFDLLESGAEA